MTHLGDIAPSAFGFSRDGKSCLPNDASVKSSFEELQRQLNRLAQRLGFSPVTVDGKIGPGTQAAAARALASMGKADQARVAIKQCGNVAAFADKGAALFKAHADKLDAKAGRIPLLSAEVLVPAVVISLVVWELFIKEEF